jgi:hypothetical protein
MELCFVQVAANGKHQLSRDDYFLLHFNLQVFLLAQSRHWPGGNPLVFVPMWRLVVVVVPSAGITRRVLGTACERLAN